jgi:hypothetical protein
MEAAISEDRPERTGGSNEIKGLCSEHIRVIALRLEGKRWSEIAAALGVTPWTVWHWRQEHPEIDRVIAQESQDFLDASKHSLAKLMPKAMQALEEEMGIPGAPRVTAARYVIDSFKKAAQGDTPPGSGPDPIDELGDSDLAELIRGARQLASGKGNR